jgi:hypothetical protein
VGLSIMSVTRALSFVVFQLHNCVVVGAAA